MFKQTAEYKMYGGIKRMVKKRRKAKVKRILAVMVLMVSVLFTSCGFIEKSEKKEKLFDEKKDEIKVSEMFFETKSISEVRSDAEKSMSVFGTNKSKYDNIGKTDIVPIITDKDEIYKIKLAKLDGNELTNDETFDAMMSSKKIINSYTAYRNDKKMINTKLNITDGTDIKDLIEFVENYMDSTYSDSPFKWNAEYVYVATVSGNQDFVSVYIRPSYDGVVFKRTVVFNDGKPTDLANTAKDFKDGTVYVTDMNKIYGYQSISPYYEVERQGEAISEILSIESVLSIVANKIDKESVSRIKLFELAYRVNRDLTAVPVWHIVVNENGVDRNFQIDVATGDVYFE